MQQRQLFLFFLFFLLPSVAIACDLDTTALANVVVEEEAATAVPPTITAVSDPSGPSPTPLQPPQVKASTPTRMAIVVAAPATATPHPTADTAVRTNDNETTHQTQVEGSTPRSTFTPPSLAATSAEEHYWLRRPVPDGGVVWTDKVYPYGGTLGGQLRPHHGVEFMVPTGTPMLAAANGTVVVAGNDRTAVYGPQPNFYGNLIVIELDSQHHGQAVYILYGHLSDILVSEGQPVAAGEVIGLSGGSGVADGPHLHFEVRVGRNDYYHTQNPLLWLYPFFNHGTVAGRVTWPDGSLVYEAPVSLRRLDGQSRYLATTTYADDNLNPSIVWRENFAIDDVPTGYYEVTVRLDDNRRLTKEVWVYAQQTSFVEIVLEE